MFFSGTHLFFFVTGASDGIGKAYSEALAEKGLNIVLISRSQEKLEKVASDIESAYNVQTKIIALDFIEGHDIYHTLEKQLMGLEIGVLVNNVGISYAHPEEFLNLQNAEKFIADMIRCNIESVPQMCRIVMPRMIERRRGVIINLSSMSAYVPSPFLTLYSSTKSFVKKFSEDLNTEYSSKGIIVQCILPGFVTTNMSKIKKPTWMTPTPQIYVKSALETTGLQENSFGYFPHSLAANTLDFIGNISPTLLKRTLINILGNIRTRSIKKLMKSK
ncbi:hypothetical protein FQA39_LY15494 [Lamprigera yunnana]|nr:hypothetical protein FQA39_LY15494 [Lamprigera yunnana]